MYKTGNDFLKENLRACLKTDELAAKA